MDYRLAMKSCCGARVTRLQLPIIESLTQLSIRFCATRFRRIEVRYSNPAPAGVHVVTELESSLMGEPSEFRGTPSAAGGFASLRPQPPSPIADCWALGVFPSLLCHGTS